MRRITHHNNHPLRQRALSLIELLVVVAILGFLSIIAVDQFDGVPSAQALALYTVANRMVGDWQAVADACAVGEGVNNRLAAASGHNAADILAAGAQLVAPAWRSCFSYVHLAPLNDVVLTENGVAVSVQGHPVQFTGGNGAPYVVTYQGVPEKVVVALMTKFSTRAGAGNILQTSYTAVDDRINYQRQAADSYQVEIIFPDAMPVTAGGQPPTGVIVAQNTPPGITPPATVPPGQGKPPGGGPGGHTPTPPQSHSSLPPPGSTPGANVPPTPPQTGTPPAGGGQKPPQGGHSGGPPSGGGNPCDNLASDPQSQQYLLHAGGAGGPVTLPNGCRVSVVTGNDNTVVNNGSPVLVIGNDNKVIGNGGEVLACGVGNTSTGYGNEINLCGVGNVATGTTPGPSSGNGAPFYVTGNGNHVNAPNGGPTVATGNGNHVSGNHGPVVTTGNSNNANGNNGPLRNTGNGNNASGNSGPVSNTGNGNSASGNSGPVSNTGNSNSASGNFGPVNTTGNGNSASGNSGPTSITGNGQSTGG